MTSMRDVNRLVLFVQTLDLTKESPEYIFEVYDRLGDLIEQFEGPEGPNVTTIRRSTSAIRGMFGMGAGKAWTAFRKKLPWLERIGTDKIPTEEYILLWSTSERARAEKDVKKVLGGADSGEDSEL